MVSRWENAPDLRAVTRLTDAMVNLYCASYARAPRVVTLDIDDTVDFVHGDQQLSLFNVHYDEPCFLPIHVYDAVTSHPVAVLLRPGTTPSGAEIRNDLRRLMRRIRAHWPHAVILHTGAYWLMLPLARRHPQTAAAGLRRVHHLAEAADQDRSAETVGRVRVAFAAAHPDAALVASLDGLAASSLPDRNSQA